MSDFVNDISRARSFGKLPERFRAADVKKSMFVLGRTDLFEFPAQAPRRKPLRL